MATNTPLTNLTQRVVQAAGGGFGGGGATGGWEDSPLAPIVSQIPNIPTVNETVQNAAQTAQEFAQQNANDARQYINEFVGESTQNIPDGNYFPTNDFGNTGEALPTQSSSGGLQDGVWQSLQYAADWNNHHGKFKFLFKVQFGGMWQFYVKSISRPKVRLNHQDVNYYNFRSKVLTSVTFEPLNIVLWDEIGNSVTNFFSTYLSYVSGQGSGNWGIDTSFDQDDDGKKSSSSSRSYRNAGYGDPMLATVIIEQVFGNGTRSNRYTLRNVRIESMDLDDLSMEENGMSTLALMFNYDSIEVETVNHSVIHTDPTASTDLLRGGGAAGNAFGANDDGRQFDPFSIGGFSSPWTGDSPFTDMYSAQAMFAAAIPNINLGVNISPYGVSGGASFGIPGLGGGIAIGPNGVSGGFNLNVPGFNAGINVGPNGAYGGVNISVPGIAGGVVAGPGGVSGGVGISAPGVSAGVTMGGSSNFTNANIAINPNGVSASVSAARTSSTTALITSTLPTPGSYVSESAYVSRLGIAAGPGGVSGLLVGQFTP